MIINFPIRGVFRRTETPSGTEERLRNAEEEVKNLYENFIVLKKELKHVHQETEILKKFMALIFSSPRLLRRPLNCEDSREVPNEYFWGQYVKKIRGFDPGSTLH